MKRVKLYEPEDLGRMNLDTVRGAAVALGRYAVNGPRGRGVGDPVHEWVTEGRRKQYEDALRAGAAWAIRMRDEGAPYSSCGDLAHWLLLCLGVRDESVVNRNDDGGDLAWRVVVNISRLTGSPWYRIVNHNTKQRPEPGDILHVQSPDHVAVLLEKTTDDQWVTADYGQPYGQIRVCPVRAIPGGLQVRGKRLVGFESLRSMVEDGALVESAIVPEDFAGGVEDDNPYSEGLPVDWSSF